MIKPKPRRHSQAIGKNFESVFSQICTYQNIICTRIPDSCKQLGSRIIRVPSPFDFIITSPIHGHAFIDTKTTNNKSFPPSAIHEYQVKVLSRHAVNQFKAGYIIHFRQSDEVIYINGDKLLHSYLNKISIIPTLDYVIHLGTLTRLDINKIFLLNSNHEPVHHNPKNLPQMFRETSQ